MKSINNFKPYCIFIESNDILEAIKNERDNSILIIEMPLISKFIIYQKIIKALKKTINDLKLSKKLYKYSLISDLVIRRYDKNFSKNYGGGRFHQDINFL